ncbi:MAG: OB-fold nucleic acid binding domain-containing protein [Promethearchaeota archaeon]
MSYNIEDIYQALLNAGIDEQEIERQVKEKFNDYQGFMSKQAILILIAKEHGLTVHGSSVEAAIYQEVENGIDYNDFIIPISKIIENMNNIVITGRIVKKFNKKEFLKKDGSLGMVGSFIIADSSGQIKIVVWNEQAEIMDNEYFNEGQVIQVIGGYSKKGLKEEFEVHLSKKGRIVLSPKSIDSINLLENLKHQEMIIEQKNSKIMIKDLYNKEGFIRAITGIAQIEEFKEITLKNGEKTFLLKLILTDDSSSIKVLVWGMYAVESLKILSNGNSVQLSNVLLKENSYTNEKELIFTKKSSLEIS